ncbi:hypothetical protein DLJ54_05400 [Corynebacterium heidelbergense]|uniref:Uncharacterized protein n=1 Tax=Corynebacterium heidelbergense TaxID=2055947 RepID=A0A364V5V8_9CORY|nr:hypothetical protein DLJ54_05400 [Corynebacterium heidelbergense]
MHHGRFSISKDGSQDQENVASTVDVVPWISNKGSGPFVRSPLHFIAADRSCSGTVSAGPFPLCGTGATFGRAGGGGAKREEPCALPSAVDWVMDGRDPEALGLTGAAGETGAVGFAGAAAADGARPKVPARSATPEARASMQREAGLQFGRWVVIIPRVVVVCAPRLG